jgi:hypothetical protein
MPRGQHEMVGPPGRLRRPYEIDVANNAHWTVARCAV